MEKQQINTEEQDIRENSSGSHFCEISFIVNDWIYFLMLSEQII